MAPTTPTSPPTSTTWRAAAGHQPPGRGRAAVPARAGDRRACRYGPDHPNVAIRLNNLAELLRATNRLAEAEPLYRRALAIDERSYGPDHPNVATDLNNLAVLLQATNRLAEAEPLYRRALAIDERSYGPDHPNVATALNNLAALLQATNRLGEAEPLYRRALAIDERSYGPDHPDVASDLNNLARLLRCHQPPRRGRAAFPSEYADPDRFPAPDRARTPEFPRLLANYGEFLEALGKTSEQIEQQLNELIRTPHAEGS